MTLVYELKKKMFNRIILITVGALFSIYCLAIAILTFIGLNFATFHLSSFWLAGFAAIYGVLSPIGLSGILGGLHRKKSLVKGFMFQYWFATGLLIGINVANILMSDELRQGAIQKCQSALFGVASSGQNSLPLCTDKVRRSESVALIFTSVQGGVMILFGFLVLFFGIKEFKDITLEEETKNLLEKAKFQEGPRNSLSDVESNISESNNNFNSTVSADNGRYNASASVSRASSRSDQGRYASTNVSRASSRSDRERFAPKVSAVPASYAPNRSLVNQNNVNQNRTPGVSSPYSTPANNASTNRINVTTQRGMQYQSPPGQYQPTPPNNNYIPSNKNNYPSSSNKNNYPLTSNRNNFPSSSSKNNYQISSNKNNYLPSSNKSNYPPLSSNNNYPPSSKSNSSPINGSSRSGQPPLNSKVNNYSSQPLPLENYPIISPERSYAVDRYGSQTSNPLSYSTPLINYAGKSKPSVGQPTIQPSPSSRNYRQPAMMNGKPPPPTNVSASRPQQKIKKGYQVGGSDYDYANDYNDYIIPSNTYVAYTKPR